jgi:hypothetical protein
VHQVKPDTYILVESAVTADPANHEQHGNTVETLRRTTCRMPSFLKAISQHNVVLNEHLCAAYGRHPSASQFLTITVKRDTLSSR